LGAKTTRRWADRLPDRWGTLARVRTSYLRPRFGLVVENKEKRSWPMLFLMREMHIERNKGRLLLLLVYLIREERKTVAAGTRRERGATGCRFG
jgi:hypothetical protein